MNSLKKIDKYFIESKFTNSFVRREEQFPFSKYVEYSIEIKTNLRKNWTIYKRYKCFQKLHKLLSKSIFNLPSFPPKKLFNMKEKVINERKNMLEYYLNYILDKVDLQKYPIITKFIQEDNYEEKTSELRSSINPFLNNINPFIPRKLSNRKSKSSDNLRLFSKNISYINPYLCFTNNFSGLINSFLENLQDNKEDKCLHIKNFWKAFLKDSFGRAVKREETIKLFFGSIKLKGLLYHCGTIEDNILGAEESLILLSKLLQFEFNPECEYYLNVLKLAQLENIKLLKLTDHMTSCKQNIREISFILISHLINNETGITLKAIVKDKYLENTYENWIEQNYTDN